MISVIEINKNNIDLCIELDANSLQLWSKKQWISELDKNGVKVIGLFLSSKIIGLTVFQVIIDEAQMHYFSIDPAFRRNGYGSYLMRYVVQICDELGLKKILLEVSDANTSAQQFYFNFGFFTVGKRKSYYKDRSSALLKEKKLIK